jgi:hypothetical protein
MNCKKWGNQLPRKRKKRRSTSKKKVTEGQLSIDTQILEKMIEGIELSDLLKLINSWGYKAQENEDITKNIDLFKTLNINAFSKSQLADLWALKALKNKIWKKFKIADSLPSRLGKISLKKRCKTALKSEGLEKKYIPHVFRLDNNRQFHIVLEFVDEPFVVETENAFSYQLIKPIARLSGILDRDEKTIYIETSDGKNSANAENFKVFENILQKALKTSFERVRVRPYELKEIADKSSKSLKKVVFVCPREISGIDGVEKITVEGDDVVAGLKDIASRHEVNLEKVGAWAEISGMNDEFLLSLDGRIKTPSLLNKK